MFLTGSLDALDNIRTRFHQFPAVCKRICSFLSDTVLGDKVIHFVLVVVSTEPLHFTGPAWANSHVNLQETRVVHQIWISIVKCVKLLKEFVNIYYFVLIRWQLKSLFHQLMEDIPGIFGIFLMESANNSWFGRFPQHRQQWSCRRHSGASSVAKTRVEGGTVLGLLLI